MGQKSTWTSAWGIESLSKRNISDDKECNISLPSGLGEDSKAVRTCIFKVGVANFCNHILLNDALIRCDDNVHFNLGL